MHGWRRPFPFAVLMAALFALGWLVPAAPPASLARPEAVPAMLPIFHVIAGGADWFNINNIADCSTGIPAFNVEDASLPDPLFVNDAYDNAFCMFVNGAPFVPPNT